MSQNKNPTRVEFSVKKWTALLPSKPVFFHWCCKSSGPETFFFCCDSNRINNRNKQTNTNWNKKRERMKWTIKPIRISVMAATLCGITAKFIRKTTENKLLLSLCRTAVGHIFSLVFWGAEHSAEKPFIDSLGSKNKSNNWIFLLWTHECVCQNKHFLLS